MSSYELLPALRCVADKKIARPNERLCVNMGIIRSSVSETMKVFHEFKEGVPKDKFRAWFGLISQFDGWKSKSSCWHHYRKYVVDGNLQCVDQKVHPRLVYTSNDTYSRQALMQAPEVPYGFRVNSVKVTELLEPADKRLIRLGDEVAKRHKALSTGNFERLDKSVKVTVGKRYTFEHEAVHWEFEISQSGFNLREAIHQSQVFTLRIWQDIPNGYGDSVDASVKLLASFFEKVRDLFMRPHVPRMPEVSLIPSARFFSNLPSHILTSLHP